MSLSRIIVPVLTAAALPLAGLLGGCTVNTAPEPAYATTTVTSAPANVETYPHTVYEGRTVYLYNDHWYYRDRERWTYYRTEPAPLRRQRPYVQQAPAAPRGPIAAPPAAAPPPRYNSGPRPGLAPQPAPAVGPGVQSAPPAVRVQ